MVSIERGRESVQDKIKSKANEKHIQAWIEHRTSIALSHVRMNAGIHSDDGENAC